MPDTDVARLADLARTHGRLGLDTEFMPEGRYRPLLCLVQVHAGGRVDVLDPLTGFDPAPLAAVLADPEVEVVVHAGRQDVAILRREWSVDFTNVFDTQVAAGFAAAIPRGGAAEPIRLDDTERLATESQDGPVIALAEALVRARAQEAGL